MEKTLKAFEPIVKFLQITKILIFDITSEGLKLSKSKLVFLIIIYILMSFFTHLRLNVPESFNMEGSSVSKTTLAITFLLSEVFYVVMNVLVTINRSKLLEVMKILTEVNKEVSYKV